MRAGLLALLFCVACDSQGDGPGPLFAEAPNRPLDLRAQISSAEVELLSELKLRIDFYRDADVEVDFTPELPAGFIGSCRIGEEQPWAEGFWRRYDLELRPTSLGDLVIPAYRVSLGEDAPAASTQEFPVQVTSVLADAKSGVEAPADPFPSRFDAMPWVYGGLAVLALAALLVFWWRRTPGRRKPVGGIALPAHIKALRALSRLRNEPRQTELEIDLFYQRVSGVLREYLEDRFGLHAPDRTTDEFLPEVEGSGLLASDQQQHLSQFLRQCDLVKFARMLPGESVHGEIFDFAERLVEETREDRQGVAV